MNIFFCVKEMKTKTRYFYFFKCLFINRVELVQGNIFPLIKFEFKSLSSIIDQVFEETRADTALTHGPPNPKKFLLRHEKVMRQS